MAKMAKMAKAAMSRNVATLVRKQGNRIQSIQFCGGDDMEAAMFNQRLRELSAMTARENATELWLNDYAELLDQVRADNDKDRRTSQASRMKTLLMHQAAFLMNQWLHCHRQNSGHFIMGGHA